jgi:ATP-binding cassette, subfamily F, member 3
MDISLKVTNLAKTYDRPLFEGVNLNVEGPAKIALIGDNGSGKSTLLKMLAGKESLPSGSVRWGKDAKVGYLEQEIVREFDEASGGEKKILRLAQLFYSDYNVLLLDEPDNHLDLENKRWFEQLVADFPGLVIVISHDRTFLRRAVDRIWLLEEGRVSDFPFNYDKFQDVYEGQMTARWHLWAVQEKERKRLEALVKEYQRRAAMSKDLASQYKSMLKRYDRFLAEMIEKPPETKKLNLAVDLEKQHKRKTAVFLKGLTKTYGNHEVLKDLSLHVFCGDKIAVNAPNGSGKSTLLNIISGRLPFDAGEVYLGPNLKVGYYTQEHTEALNDNATLVDELQKDVHLHHFDAVNYLKRFMFTDAQIASPVKYLSGG